MKNLFILFVLMTLHFSSYSQKKKRKAIPPPAPYVLELSTDTLSLQEGQLPILFQWKMNADTTLKPGTVFKELIKLTYGQTQVNGNYSLQPVTLKKATGSKNAPESEIPKMITSVSYYDVAVANGIITLKERGQTFMTLKVIYDKNKQVSHLKDLNKGTIYRHIESDEPVIGL